jgi:ATP-dependent RNA helicase DDX52/ROK1
LPTELDFFKYTEGGSSKRKGGFGEQDKETKKARAETEDSSEESEKPSTSTSSFPRQRVTAKGSNVPLPFESFEELQSRYDMSPLLLSNLSDCGYNHPTGIQSHGIPILLEVSFISTISQFKTKR